MIAVVVVPLLPVLFGGGFDPAVTPDSWLANGIVDLIGRTFEPAALGLNLPSGAFVPAVLSWLTAVAVVLLYREVVHIDIVLLGLAVSVGISAIDRSPTAHTHAVSVVLFVLGVAVLVEGVRRDHSGLLFLAGFIFFFNVFSRFQNILGLFLVFLVPVFNRFLPEEQRSSFRVRTVVLFLAGAFTAELAGFFIMQGSGELSPYMTSLVTVWDSVFGPANGGVPAAAQPLVDAGLAVVSAIPVLVSVFLLSLAFSRIVRPALRVSAALASAAAAVLLLRLMGIPVSPFQVRLVAALSAGVSYLFAVPLFMRQPDFSIPAADSSTRFRLVSFLSVGSLFIVSIDADAGIVAASHALPAVVPFVLTAAAVSRPFFSRGRRAIERPVVSVPFLAIIVLFTVVSVVSITVRI